MMKELLKQEESEINVSKNINDEADEFNLNNAKRLWGNAERFQGISKYYASFYHFSRPSVYYSILFFCCFFQGASITLQLGSVCLEKNRNIEEIVVDSDTSEDTKGRIYLSHISQ